MNKLDVCKWLGVTEEQFQLVLDYCEYLDPDAEIGFEYYKTGQRITNPFYNENGTVLFTLEEAAEYYGADNFLSFCSRVLNHVSKIDDQAVFLTVNQLLALLATDNCQIDFYDSTHQIEEMLTERDLREGKNKFNWMDAKVEYFNVVGVDDINLCCLLKEADVHESTD